jgi:O-antigen/teichoic acid export membrane protein
MAMLSGPVIRLLYGPKYVPTISVLAISGALALFKPLFLPVFYLFKAHSRQSPMLIWNTICGALNLGIDWLLIPGLGAVGASIGNGTAQALAVVGLWVIARSMFDLRIDLVSISKIALAVLAMAPPVLLIAYLLPPYLAIPCGVAAGAAAFFLVLRPLRVIASDDMDRLQHFRPSLPGPARPLFDSGLRWLVTAS